MFCCSENGNDNMRWRREMLPRRPGGEPITDTFTTRRRGSLPIDVLLATHSGDSYHSRLFLDNVNFNCLYRLRT